MKAEENIEVCSNCEVHSECVNCVKESMLDSSTFTDIADLFKVLGDYTRIRIIYALFKKELCVCDISEVLGMTQSSISHQLRVLKSYRLVKFRKEGKTVFYSLNDEHIQQLFNAGLDHVIHG